MINFYMVLGLPDFAPGDTVRDAYRAKCREYHPDRVAGLGEKIRAVAEREMVRVNRAWQTLGDAASRAGFDRDLKDALDAGGLMTCRLCGLRFTPDEFSASSETCPLCRQDSSKAAWREGDSGGLDAEALLRACFITLHHFLAKCFSRKFNPSVNIVVCGERLKVFGPPGTLRIAVIDNRELFDLVVEDARTIKLPWNAEKGIGRIKIDVTHPVEMASTLWDLCCKTFSEPCIEYCHIAINNDDYLAYENVLSDSVMMAAAGVSPWTAVHLRARHGKNLAEAMRDPDAAAHDAFFHLLSNKSAPAENNEAPASEPQELPEAAAPFENTETQPELPLENIETSVSLEDMELLRLELAAAAQKIETRNEEVASLSASLVNAGGRIDKFARDIDELFVAYSQFHPGAPPRNAGVDDLRRIMEKMHHDILMLRSAQRRAQWGSSSKAPSGAPPVFAPISADGDA